MENKKKFYAVARGRTPGIYTQWFGPGGAEVQVRGIAGARFKGFFTREEAEAWMKDPKSAKTAPKIKTAKEPPAAPRKGDIVIYTDGGCSHNPGPGGYGAVVLNDGKREELCGGFRLTTNNRMELFACIAGLSSLKETSRVTLFSDSKYVVDAVTKGWAKKWQAREWVKSDGKNALNPDLWSRLLTLLEFHDVRFVWVKGHAGNIENERCDCLATTAAAGSGLPPDKGYKK